MRTFAKKLKASDTPINIDFGNVKINNGAIKAVDLAEDAARFCTINHVDVKGSLSIVINSPHSYFTGNIYYGYPVNFVPSIGFYWESSSKKKIIGKTFSLLQNIDQIYINTLLRHTSFIFLSNDDFEHENTVYHEFGHFMMWKIQGTWFTDPDDAPSEHSSSKQIAASTAWIEGWANGFMAMVDAHYRKRDGEYGLGQDGYRDYDQFSLVSNINIGFHNEYYIGSGLFDLWDGEFLGLNNGDKTWNDKDNDFLSLDFYTLCRPLFQVYKIGAKGNGNIVQNYAEYIERLSNMANNCNDRSEIAHINRYNNLVIDAEKYDATARNVMYGSLSSSGFLGNYINVPSVSPLGGDVKIVWGFSTGKDPGSLLESFHKFIIKDPIDSPIDLNINLNGDNFKQYLTDPLSTDHNVKNINLLGFQTRPIVETCGRANINIANDLEKSTYGLDVFNIGSMNKPVELIIGNGTLMTNQDLVEVHPSSILRIASGGAVDAALDASIIRLKKGSKLIVESNGSLVIRQGCKIIVEKDAELILKNGAFICNNGEIRYEDGYKSLKIEGAIKSGVSLDCKIINKGSLNCGDYLLTIKGTQNATGVVYNKPKCNGVNTSIGNPSIDRNFSFGIQNASTAWNDGTISWFFPTSWQVTGSNPTGAYEYSRSGTVGFAKDNEEAYAIVNSSAGVQVVTFLLKKPNTPLVYFGDSNGNEIFGGKLELCDYNGGEPVEVNIRNLMRVGANPGLIGEAPYTYQWQLPWDLNYTNGSQYGQLLIHKSQPRSNMEALNLRVTDANYCTYETKLTIVPSVAWYGGYLSSQYANTGTSIFHNVKSSKEEQVYFVNKNGELRYYYWDIAQSRWSLNTPIATNVTGHIEIISEDNNYINLGYIKDQYPLYQLQQISYNKSTKTWSIPQTIFSNNETQKFFVKGKDNNFYFVNSLGNLCKVTSTTAFSVVANAVRGVELLATSEGIFFLQEINGIQKIALFKTLNSQVTVFESNVKPFSQLNKDKNESVYFINNLGAVSYLPKIGGTYGASTTIPYLANPNSKSQVATTNFSINPNTDVIYYTGISQDIYQLYPVKNNQWLSVNILGASWNSNSKVTGYITYNSPHPFFLSNGNIGNYFYIPQANCSNIIERQGSLNTEIGISVMPNPADKYIKVLSSETEEVDYIIRNLSGTIILKGKIYSGDYIEMSTLIEGSYFIELTQNSTNHFSVHYLILR